jgi:uncharacterized protein (DUF1499 family)
MISHARDESHRIAPLAFTGDAPTAMTRLAQVVARQLGATLAGQDRDCTCAASQTLVTGFVNDVPFLANPAQQVIDATSASRSGHSDPGVNRKRVEAGRAAFAAGKR